MSLYSVEPSLLPNLPGYRARQPKSGFRKQQFQRIGNQIFLKDDILPALDADEEGSILSLTSNVSKLKKNNFHQTPGVVLTFQAYFEERLSNSLDDIPQVRHCKVLYFMEDGTMKIVEKPTLNSAVAQGVLVRRGLLFKPDGTPYTENDLDIGSWLPVFGKTYRLVDCDPGTRKFIEGKLGKKLSSEVIEVPADEYQAYRNSLQPGPSEEWGKHHSKKNDNKTFIEARLGHTVDNKGREGFIRYGNQALKFRCIWDNTSNLYGDIMEYTLLYYLSDDTVEIISVPNPNRKDQLNQKLLKRSKLPRNFEMTKNLGDRPSSASFFHWSDFYIGMMLDVYARHLEIIDADNRTREFYSSYDIPLSEPIFLPAPEVTVHQREIPPPTGFGSEEDSLRSVSGSLLPGPLPMKKLGENKTLQFFAAMLSGGVDDVDRRFVITFYVTDSTLKIIEPPIRNSGFTGGMFLSRRTIKLENGELLNERDLYVGMKLRVLKHTFRLLDCDEGTLRWMEDKDLWQSSFYKIMDKIRPAVLTDAMSGELAEQFRAMEAETGAGPGQCTKEGLQKVLEKYHMVGDLPHLVTEHELRTIMRANGNRLSTFNYVKVIEQLISPTDEFK